MAHRFSFIFVLFLLALILQPVQSQEMTQPEVAEMMFCTGVEDRVPVGVDTMFLDNVEQVYCFTKITGVSGSATISHLWYFEDQEMTRVDLTVMGDPWRTWSSKKILEEWGGNWRVDVVSEAGDILRSENFMIQTVSE
ncbi:MAG: DUF2914 domain-containing protein [Calditrichaeota bacterium]|nr:MAG: DUF2914 domain-containing protein [Calditrichota bacterium]